MCENIENCCRICLDADSEHVSILEDLTIHLHIKSCLAMTVSANDELPKSICLSCVSQLSDFYNFQLNARCSLDWLSSQSSSSIQEKSKKSETKTPIQPLPDSEYNSDSLLEFLNNTANIEEYLNNLGKDDIPSLVNMLDRNQEHCLDAASKVVNKSGKQLSPKKKESTVIPKNPKINMEIDVLDSEIEVVKEILMKETEPAKKIQSKSDKNPFSCFACKNKFDNIQKLSQHLSTCDNASRSCISCNLLFDSKHKMQQHSILHTSLLTCNCGKQFSNKQKLTSHHKICHVDYASTMGCIYRCKQCHETFRERFQLYRHAKEHVMKSEKRICDICGHSFIGNEALSKHRKEEHGRSEDLIYRCKICSHTSSDHKEIYLHVQKHTAIQELDRHLCESCGRSFTTRASLIRHSLQHGHMKYTCNICNKSFEDLKIRDKHVLEHIDMSMCERCGQNVNTYKLDEHLCV